MAFWLSMPHREDARRSKHEGLVKRYGATAAVSDPSFTIRPGLVTSFPGPNGFRSYLGEAARAAGRVPADRPGEPAHPELTRDHGPGWRAPRPGREL